MTQRLNAFTVDVEDYFQVTSFEKVVARDQWSRLESRVVANTHRILELLAAGGVHATFFVLGWVAEQFPQLVRDIHAAGHELACHGYWHRLIYQQSPQEFREDLRRSKRTIEDAAGIGIEAYRAPSFSITRKSWWALEVLVEEGFTIDSSIFPTAHDRYGVLDAPAHIHTIDTRAGSILEFPMTVAKLGPFSLPVGGGGYFRLYPYSLTDHLLARVNGALQRPFTFYIHPWEVDPSQPRMQGGAVGSRFRHYVNLRSCQSKLRRLLARFRFGTLSEVVNDWRGSDANESVEQCSIATSA